MKKKGASHIEVILAFVLFIVSLSVLFYFFNPVNNTDVANSALDYLFREIVQENSVQLDIYSIKINSSLGMPDVITLEINNIPMEENVSAETYDGIRLNSEREGNFVYLEHKNKEFIYLKFSEEFDNSWKASQASNLDYSYYQLGLLNSRKILSGKRIVDLNYSYYQNYNSLKEILGVPSGVDFAFSLDFGDKKIEAQNLVPNGLQVYSKTEKLEVGMDSGDIGFADLSVRVW